jgi:hypothetical protein
MLNRAVIELERALAIDPESRFARAALAAVQRQLH